MKSIIADQHERVAKWVGERVDEDMWGDCKTIGLLEGDELIAGVVYNLYNGPSICMHVAAVPGKRWMTREYLQVCFAYPFLQLGCRRVTALTRVDNKEAIRFIEHLGFRREGIIREACTDGTDMYLLGMLRKECRFLGVKR